MLYICIATKISIDIMKQAIIFSRVSSENDRQNTDRQISDLTAFAAKNDMEVINAFSEHISGAKRNTERPILAECIDFCINHNIDTLLLSELSRLGRNTVEVLKSLDILHENGVNVFIQNLNLNTLLEDKTVNPLASLITVVLAEMYKIERTNIQYRLNSGRSNYISNGGILGRKAGSIKSKDSKKEEYKNVIAYLKKGQSVRNVAKLTDISVSTVQRIKKEFEL